MTEIFVDSPQSYNNVFFGGFSFDKVVDAGNQSLLFDILNNYSSGWKLNGPTVTSPQFGTPSAAGVTAGPFTTITSIKVEGGIITQLTGS
jgi:hypothetical protein